MPCIRGISPKYQQSQPADLVPNWSRERATVSASGCGRRGRQAATRSPRRHRCLQPGRGAGARSRRRRRAGRRALPHRRLHRPAPGRTARAALGRRRFTLELIRVRRNYTHAQEGTPKSGKDRAVPLMPDVAAALARLGQRPMFTSDEDLVFCNVVGEHRSASGVSQHYRAALKRGRASRAALSRSSAHVRDARNPRRRRAGPVLSAAGRRRKTSRGGLRSTRSSDEEAVGSPTK